MYIAFEGVDGCGKSTMAQKLALRRGMMLTGEPFGKDDALSFESPVAALARLALDRKYTEKISCDARELILLANRAIGHAFEIEPWVKQGRHIVTDRSFLSGMVYAKYNGWTFDRWFSIAIESQAVRCLPDAIVYCEPPLTPHIEKREGDAYDNAPAEFHEKIAGLFDLALDWIRRREAIKIIRFEVDFGLLPEENFVHLEAVLDKSIGKF